MACSGGCWACLVSVHIMALLCLLLCVRSVLAVVVLVAVLVLWAMWYAVHPQDVAVRGVHVVQLQGVQAHQVCGVCFLGRWRRHGVGEQVGDKG